MLLLQYLKGMQNKYHLFFFFSLFLKQEDIAEKKIKLLFLINLCS